MFRKNQKNQSENAVVEAQRGFQDLARFRRKLREEAYDSVWGKEGGQVIKRVYPPLVDYYALIDVVIVILMGLLLLGVAGILVYMIGYSIYYKGLEATLEDFRVMAEEFRWNDMVFLVLFVLFFVLLLWGSSITRKYMEHTVCIFKEQHVHIRKYLRKDKIVTYEEIGECIKKRKIRVQNGGLKIPYKGGYISVSALESGIPSEVTSLLGSRYGIWFKNDKFNTWVRKSGAGWSFTHLGGLMLIFLGLWIGLMGFVAEGQFTWEYAIFDSLNIMTFLGLCCVEIGLMFNLILYVPTWIYFRPNKEHVKVPFRVFFFILFMVGIVWMGLTKSFGYVSSSVKPPGEEMESQMGKEAAEQFCLYAFGKEYDKVTAEEFARVKYLKIRYNSSGLSEIQYSFHDYEEFTNDEEFEKTVQTLTKDMGYYNQSYPADFTMFTGLTYLDITQCQTSDIVFPGESKITRIVAKKTPAMLAELINPEYVEVLFCECKDDLDEYIAGIEKYTQLREFSYYNTENLFLDATDINSLQYCKNLQKIHLECGKAYKGLNALGTITGLKSVYIDKATFNECTFLKNTPQLEELFVNSGEEPDFTMLSYVPRLRVLRFLSRWDSVNPEGLQVLTELEELCVGVSNPEGLETVAQLSNLQVLEVWCDQLYRDNVLDISNLANLTNLRELKVEMIWNGSAIGVESVLQLPKLETLSFKGRDCYNIFNLWIDSGQLVNNSTIANINLLNSPVWDSNTGNRAEEQLKEHCLNLVQFSQEETD